MLDLQSYVEKTVDIEFSKSILILFGFSAPLQGLLNTEIQETTLFPAEGV